ncbi:hypothetical protein A2U01_0084347, partial [Trifolium medium]|nr:hypothetical protein [Trifolium medium]
TPPPREGGTSPTTKKGKTVDRSTEHRHRSPQGLLLMAKQGVSASDNYRGGRGSRSTTPPRHDNNSPLQSPNGSDEDDPRCPLSRDI